MEFPFNEKQISSNCFLREFKKNVNSEELVWHMDREDRYVTVKSGKGWHLQIDNSMPVLLESNKRYFIPKYTYHRIIKGSTGLVIEINKIDHGDENKMNLKREEIVWLMENYGTELSPEKPNCGCGKDPCETYGALDATVDGDALRVDMSATTISGKPDHEIEMAHKQLHRTANQAQSLADRMHDMGETNLPAWVQSKITMASDYISKVHGYLDDLLSGSSEESTEIVVMKEEMEGDIPKARHDVEIELSITKSDMKKLHDGEEVVLKDKTGTNSFMVTVRAL